MSDRLIQSVLAAPADDGLINLLVMAIMAAIWLIGSLSRARSKRPSPGPGSQPTTVDESVPEPVQGPGENYPEESPTLESAESMPDEVSESYQERATAQSSTVSLPGPHDQAASQAYTQTLGPESEPAPIELPEIDSALTSYSLTNLWTTHDLGEAGDDQTNAWLDPEQLRQAIIVSELLAEPVSMRPME